MRGKKKIWYWILGVVTAVNAAYFAYNQVAYRPDPRQEIERAFAGQTLAIMAQNIPAVEMTVSAQFTDVKVTREAALREMIVPRRRYYRDISSIKIEGRRAFIDYKLEETLRGQDGAPDESWRREVKEEMWNRDADDRWRLYSAATSIQSKRYDAAAPMAAVAAVAKAAPAKRGGPAAASGVDSEGEASQELYVYNPINRRDPFKAFLQLENPDARIAAANRGGALMRYSLDQLKLVGVMWGEMGLVGLVETNDGDAYSIRVGDPIGKAEGRVKTISKAGMVVEQRQRNLLGEMVVSNIPMKLHLRSRDAARTANVAAVTSIEDGEPIAEEAPAAVD